MAMNLNNQDYYILEDGRLVFTAAYHLKRGVCCGSACLHCPFDYCNVPEPKRTQILLQRKLDHHANSKTKS